MNAAELALHSSLLTVGMFIHVAPNMLLSTEMFVLMLIPQVLPVLLLLVRIDKRYMQDLFSLILDPIYSARIKEVHLLFLSGFLVRVPD